MSVAQGIPPNVSFAPPPSASLYVGDLHPDVTEALLFEVFSCAGQVSSIRVCRDAVTRRSLGYAYVNYHSTADADRALNTLNFSPIKNIPCRIMWSQRDPAVRKSSSSNVFVKNLPESMDNKGLYDLFSSYGNILSCKVVLDQTMKSKRFGFVHFASDESADQAIAKLNGNTEYSESQPIYVARFQRRADRTSGRFTNLYVKDVPKTWDEKTFRKTFEAFGEVDSSLLPKGEQGSNKGFGYVNYKSHDDALRAIEEGRKIDVEDGKQLYVDRFQSRQERDNLLHKRAINLKRDRAEKCKNLNLYVKNLPDHVTSEKLYELFKKFGDISSAVVMTTPQKQSKGFGFVCFKTEEGARKALEEMHSKFLSTSPDETEATPDQVDAKPLYVNRAQPKEERKRQLEHQFQASLGMQGYPMYYPSPMLSPHPLVYAPQMFAGPQRRLPQQFRQFQPFATPGQVKRGGRGGAGAAQFGRGGGPGAGRGAAKSRGGLANARSQVVPPATAAPVMQNPQLQQEWTSLLANEPSVEKRKNMLGEKLFPLIAELNEEMAAKITGMLLEMDVGEILTLIESPQERQAKVSEALDVLNMHQGTA
jgi:polyadenylate-binding protein